MKYICLIHVRIKFSFYFCSFQEEFQTKIATSFYNWKQVKFLEILFFVAKLIIEELRVSNPFHPGFTFTEFYEILLFISYFIESLLYILHVQQFTKREKS